LYDQMRPPFADALMDELAALQPAATLDIGCGTGKAALALAERGLSVLGVEPDERMAVLARERGVPVEVATFEVWEDLGRQFDLVVCANAWHWVDPVLGFAKVARILRPGGVFALLFAVDRLDLAVATELAPVYRAHAAEIPVYGDPTPRTSFDPFAGIDLFTSIESKYYPAERTLSGAEWANLLATVSDHQRLGQPRLANLQQAICKTIDGLGGLVQATCGTRGWLACRAGWGNSTGTLHLPDFLDREYDPEGLKVNSRREGYDGPRLSCRDAMFQDFGRRP
jgi:SAM-dependent methyltransferase